MSPVPQRMRLVMYCYYSLTMFWNLKLRLDFTNFSKWDVMFFTTLNLFLPGSDHLAVF